MAKPKRYGTQRQGGAKSAEPPAPAAPEPDRAGPAATDAARTARPPVPVRHGHEAAPVSPAELVAGHHDTYVPGIVTVGFALAAVVLVACLTMRSFLELLSATRLGRYEDREVLLPPAKAADDKLWRGLPAQQRRELAAAEAAALTTYEWIDRGAGKVRIPIERAMDLVAARGLPVRAVRSQTDRREDGQPR